MRSSRPVRAAVTFALALLLAWGTIDAATADRAPVARASALACPASMIWDGLECR
jgi:hypothetical protein